MPLTFERAKELVCYDPDTGRLTWKIDGRKRKAGEEAGGSLLKGYKRLKIDYQTYSHHQVAWLLMTGSLPEQIDHINGVRADNRWVNLREATYSQNLANRPGRAKSGLPKGVYRRRNGRFSAQAWKGGIKHGLGTYDTVEEAHAAYLAAAKHLHGEFARA